jgi:hypothetical protein
METHDIGRTVRAKLLTFNLHYFASSQIPYKNFFHFFLNTELHHFAFSKAHLLISFLLPRLLLSVVLLYFFCYFVLLKIDYKCFSKTVLELS